MSGECFCRRCVVHDDPGGCLGIVVEASELGLAPGAWPATITLDGVRATFVEFVRSGGEVMAGLYRSDHNIPVHVLND